MTPVEITRTFPAPPERLWHALTDPAALAAWFWPHLDNTVDVDLRVGGRYRITGPRAGIAVDGEYLAVDPPKRLVFTWQWDARGRAQPGSGGAAPAGEDTELTLVHDRIGDNTTRDRFAAGWRDCLDRLPGRLRT